MEMSASMSKQSDQKQRRQRRYDADCAVLAVAMSSGAFRSHPFTYSDYSDWKAGILLT